MFDLFLNPDNLVEPSKRIKNVLKDELAENIPRFPFTDYSPLFQLEYKRFLFVNMDFIDLMMKDSTKKFIEEKLKALSKNYISNPPIF